MSSFTKAERAEIAESFATPRSVSTEAVRAAADGPFCTAWPVAKAGLEELEKLAQRPLVKLLIRQVIGIGDIAFEERCQ